MWQIGLQLLCMVLLNWLLEYSKRRIARKRAAWFPELSLLDDKDRDQVWDAAAGNKALLGRGSLLTAVALVIVIVVVMQMSASAAFHRTVLQGLIVSGVIMGTPLVRSYFLRKQISVAIRTELNQRGIPTCMHCGYSLKGMAGSLCSECGRPHHAGTCWPCRGQGRSSRHWILLMGFAFFGGWALLAAALQWSMGNWGHTGRMMAVTSPGAIIGANMIAWYIIGGPSKLCPTCRGTGSLKSQGET